MSGKLIIEMTSRECNRYLVEGGDIAVLPVGSLEVLGPHLPVGSKWFVVEAFARLLADAVEGIRLPVTLFGSVAHTFDRPGSVTVPGAVLNDYVRAAMEDLYVSGFRRLLVLTYQDYLAYYVPQEFYEDHQVAAAGMNLGEVLYEFGPEVGPDSIIVGALRVLGKHDLAEKVMAENARLLAEGATLAPFSPELSRVMDAGAVGFTYPSGGFPLGPNPDLSGEAGEKTLRDAAIGLAPAVGRLRDYNDFLAKRGTTRGLTWRGWRWTE